MNLISLLAEQQTLLDEWSEFAFKSSVQKVVSVGD